MSVVWMESAYKTYVHIWYDFTFLVRPNKILLGHRTYHTQITCMSFCECVCRCRQEWAMFKSILWIETTKYRCIHHFYIVLLVNTEIKITNNYLNVNSCVVIFHLFYTIKLIIIKLWITDQCFYDKSINLDMNIYL